MIRITERNVVWAVMNLTGRMLKNSVKVMAEPYRGQRTIKTGPFQFHIEKTGSNEQYRCRITMSSSQMGVTEGPSPYGALYSAVIKLRLHVMKMDETGKEALAIDINNDTEIYYNATERTYDRTEGDGFSTAVDRIRRDSTSQA